MTWPRLLDRSLMMGWSEELRKPWKGCLCLCFFVCLSVCLLTRYRSHFSTQQPNFLKICSLGLWEKKVFSVFRNFYFWRFYGLFSLFSEFFPLCLCTCIGHKPTHSTYKHNFWHVGSLWHRKSKKIIIFWKFSFLTIWGPFLTIFENLIVFFHLMYIVFGIGT